MAPTTKSKKKHYFEMHSIELAYHFNQPYYLSSLNLVANHSYDVIFVNHTISSTLLHLPLNNLSFLRIQIDQHISNHIRGHNFFLSLPLRLNLNHFVLSINFYSDIKEKAVYLYTFFDI